MWLQAGEYREKPKDPPSEARVKAMLKQCRIRGSGGCNCQDQCKAELAAGGVSDGYQRNS